MRLKARSGCVYYFSFSQDTAVRNSSHIIITAISLNEVFGRQAHKGTGLGELPRNILFFGGINRYKENTQMALVGPFGKI